MTKRRPTNAPSDANEPRMRDIIEGVRPVRIVADMLAEGTLPASTSVKNAEKVSVSELLAGPASFGVGWSWKKP